LLFDGFNPELSKHMIFKTITKKIDLVIIDLIISIFVYKTTGYRVMALVSTTFRLPEYDAAYSLNT